MFEKITDKIGRVVIWILFHFCSRRTYVGVEILLMESPYVYRTSFPVKLAKQLRDAWCTGDLARFTRLTGGPEWDLLNKKPYSLFFVLWEVGYGSRSGHPFKDSRS